MAALDNDNDNVNNILNQSFLEEYERFIKKNVSISENSNVEKLFKEVQTKKTDCNICYEEETTCIQCYQCDFNYCQQCLNKIISEFNKCSACQANFKNNYACLKEKNKKARPSSINSTNAATKVGNANTKKGTSRSAFSAAYGDLMMSDFEIEQLAVLIQLGQLNIDPRNDNTEQQSSNDFNNQKPNNKPEANRNVIINQYLDSGFNENIEPCQFQSVKPNARYNFCVCHDQDSNELIYTPTDNNLTPIIINYKLLDKTFQRSLFINLVELLDNPNKFINIWQNIAVLIHNFTQNYIYLNRNGKRNISLDQEFLYQRQDLINIINQMVMY
jgi:hypothetical protein